MLIDTSRNGSACSARVPAGTQTTVDGWSGAGHGERPAAAPAAGIDACVQVEPPGESDGKVAPGGNARNGNNLTGPQPDPSLP